MEESKFCAYFLRMEIRKMDWYTGQFVWLMWPSEIPYKMIKMRRDDYYQRAKYPSEVKNDKIF